MAQVITNRFTNELGNEIYARVTEAPIGGVPGVILYIAGPDSDMEMHVTRKEAQELLALLSKSLKPSRK